MWTLVDLILIIIGYVGPEDGSATVVAEELFSINSGQRTCYSRAVSGFAHENVEKTCLGGFTVICILYSDLTV